MSEKYWFLMTLRVLALRGEGDLLLRLSAWEKVDLREESRGVHHGLDLGEGVDHLTRERRAAFSLAKLRENHSSRTAGEGRPGRAEIGRPVSASSTSLSVSDAQQGVGAGGARKGQLK